MKIIGLNQFDYESLFNNIISVNNQQIWVYKNRRSLVYQKFCN